MPIILEHISQLSDNDRESLAAIYQDYSIEGGQTTDIVGYLQQQHKDQPLYTGRFNGQLVAALWLEPGGGYHTIRDLYVHPVTRGRGVARQTLTLLQQYARNKSMLLCIEDGDLPDYLHHLPERCGFIRMPNTNDQPQGWQSDLPTP